MTPLIVPGTYGDALPTGEWCATDEPRSEFRSWPTLPPPPQVPLYPRIHSAPFKVCGQGQQSGLVLFDGHRWSVTDPAPNGQSGAIFDQAGELHVIAPGPHVTTQGYRYVARSGRLIMGDATLARHDFQLSEWTELDGIIVGQNQHGPELVIVQGGLAYVLDAGPAFFPRFTKLGSRCAVSVSSGGFTRFYFFTVDEIRNLRRLDAPAPAPRPPAPPPPPRIEEPTMKLPATEVALSIVQEERGRSAGHMDANQIVAFLRGVAGRLNAAGYGPFGLLKKDGHNCGGYSCDVIGVNPPAGQQIQFDVLRDVNTDQAPTWDRVPREKVTVRELEIVPPSTGPVESHPPVAPPSAPMPSTADLARIIEQQGRDIVMLRNEISTAKVEAREGLHALAHDVAVERLRIEKVDDPSVPEVSTSREWGHSHRLRLRIVRGE